MKRKKKYYILYLSYFHEIYRRVWRFNVMIKCLWELEQWENWKKKYDEFCARESERYRECVRERKNWKARDSQKWVLKREGSLNAMRRTWNSTFIYAIYWNKYDIFIYKPIKKSTCSLIYFMYIKKKNFWLLLKVQCCIFFSSFILPPLSFLF